MTTMEETTLIRQTRNLALEAGRFLWHFAQMVVVMEAGMLVYHSLIMPLLAPFGLRALMTAQPLLCYWLMVASMTLPMIALMRIYHKATWRYTLEMTASMLAPVAVLCVLVLGTVCPIGILYSFGDPLMYVTMAAFLLLRPAQHSHGGQTQACHMQ
jgi:hypothetical protein